jgi:hypothetical protein
MFGGLLVANDTFFVGRLEQIVALAARSAVPAMHFLREFAAVGGLMSYRNSLADAYHRIGISGADWRRAFVDLGMSGSSFNGSGRRSNYT